MSSTFPIDFLDVSSWQGGLHGTTPPDWSLIPYPAILKASEDSSTVDGMYATNLPQARAHGLLQGAYHFLVSTVSGQSQAQHFLRVINDNGGLYPHELIVLDHETDPYSETLPQNYEPIAQEFIDTLNLAGHHDQLRYYGPSWMAHFASNNAIPFWCAAYISNEDFIRSTGAVAWQWSSSVYVPGITRSVDVSMVFDKATWLGEPDMNLNDLAAAFGAEVSGNQLLFTLRDGSKVTLATALSYNHEESQLSRFKLMGTDSAAVNPTQTVTEEIASIPHANGTACVLADLIHPKP